jgi:hypothetical protein
MYRLNSILFFLAFFFSRIVFNTVVSYFVGRAYYLTTKDVGVIFSFFNIFKAIWSSIMVTDHRSLSDSPFCDFLHPKSSLVHGNTEACKEVNIWSGPVKLKKFRT